MTDGEPPIWLLDVDGVINASRAGWSAAPRSRLVYEAYGSEWKVTWAPQLVRWIHRIHRDGIAEVVWCTTWCPSAHVLERLWGWPPLRRAWTTHLHGYRCVEAKRAAAREVLAGGRRLIWTDDDAFPARGWPALDLLAGGRALLIKPDARFGLRPDDLAAIEEFAGGGPGPDTVRVSTKVRRSPASVA